MQKETPLTVYQGFQIVLPSNMTDKKPFLWLQKNGRYYVAMGDTEVGTLIRIDNFLDSLDKYIEKSQKVLESMNAKKETIESELAKNAEMVKKKQEEYALKQQEEENNWIPSGAKTSPSTMPPITAALAVTFP